MIIKTTEQKIRDAGWDHYIYEPGYFFKEISGVKVDLVEEEYEEHQDGKASNYEVHLYEDPDSPDGLIAIASELKKLEVK